MPPPSSVVHSFISQETSTAWKEEIRDDHVQGLAPFPGAWFEVSGERIKLLAAEKTGGRGEPGEVLDGRLEIACGNGALRPTLVQRAGKGAMTPDELLRGFAIAEGTILS